ncbi:MAG: hypothetical protein J6O61_08555 [Butyrivibrio sp.]|uniref:hypothetical protein n=1 Tax=Butyrivibrio sp. TaxID=28121 RepID=UPI001B06DF2E|nr:hypothetical protein [Butyrivibrio sp.]MBO6240859.1 hypothetical protein [Butyrivibrio sp.]
MKKKVLSLLLASSMVMSVLACGDCGSANKAEYLTILEFTHFCEFFSFNYVEENRKEKLLIQKITVAVAFELETGNTKNPDIKVNMDTIE